VAVRPGGVYAGRPLNVIWLLDCSGPMAISGKIDALNNAIREMVPAMGRAAEGNPEVQFYVRLIRFATGATWHIVQPTLLTDFEWSICTRKARLTWVRPLPCWQRKRATSRRMPASRRRELCSSPMATPE
jgi:hypothetical protein